MKERCGNSKNAQYKHYGARGIAVCDEWAKSFESFLRDMGARPAGTSIDRIKTDGNYEPGNCRWADAQTQQGNRRTGVYVQLPGGSITYVAEAARRLGLARQRVHGMMMRGLLMRVER